MYQFPVSNVDTCPLNKTAWEAASVNLNCSRGASRSNRYHCVPNLQKSALIEFCYDKFSGRYEKDNCIYLADSGYLNSESCSTFSHGCPTTSYLGDEIYKYPECLQINTISKCFVADNSCENAANRDSTTVNISTAVNTTRTNFTSNSTTVDTIQENSTGVHVAGLVAGASVGTVLSAVIIVMLIYLYRRNRKQDRSPDDETYMGLIDPFPDDEEREPLTDDELSRIAEKSLKGRKSSNNQSIISDDEADRLPDDVAPSSLTDRFLDDEAHKPLIDRLPHDEAPLPLTDPFPDDEEREPLTDRLSYDDAPLLLTDPFPDDEARKPLTDRLPDDEAPLPLTDGLVDDEACMPLIGKAPNIDQDQHMILYLFLIVDGCCIGQRVLHDFEKSWLQKLNRIRKLFEMTETKEDDVLDVFELVDEGSAIDDFLTWDVEDIKVKSKEAKDKIFWSFYNHELVSSNITKSEHVKVKIRFLLAESQCHVLKNYFRVAGYANKEGEEIVCLDEEYTDEMIEKFNIDVIALGNKDDQTFLQRVSEKVKIPLEALVLDEMNLRSYVQQMIKGKERMYCGRCIILGCGGSGKTTLLARLKNENMTAEEIKSLNIESTIGADFSYDVFIVDEDKGTLIKNIQEAKSYFTRSDRKEIEKSTEHSESDIQDQDRCTSDTADIENIQEAKSYFTGPGSLDRRFSKESVKSTEHPKSDVHDKEGCKSDIADIENTEDTKSFLTEPLDTNLSKETRITIEPVEVEMNEIDRCQANIDDIVIEKEKVISIENENYKLVSYADSKEEIDLKESYTGEIPSAVIERHEADEDLFLTAVYDKNKLEERQSLTSDKQDPLNTDFIKQEPMKDPKQNSVSNGSNSKIEETVKLKEHANKRDGLSSDPQMIKIPSIHEEKSIIESRHLDDIKNDILIASQQKSSYYSNSRENKNKGKQSENTDDILTSNQQMMDQTFKYEDSTVQDEIKNKEFYKQVAMNVPEENFKSISVLDCAGQCTYYPGHQIHMNSASVYILCVNMAKNLDAQVEGIESDQRGTAFDGNTYMDYINFFMHSLYVYNKSGNNETGKHFVSEKEEVINKATLPVPLIVIGTHADEAEIDFSEFTYHLCRKLVVDFDKNNIYKLGFPTNKSDYRHVSEIKKCITRVVTEGTAWGQEVPRSYIIFESLVRIARKSFRRIMKFEEFEKQNEVLDDDKMSTVDLITMLIFFHNIGLILYFKDSVAKIGNTIIVDIQWFIDAFKNIIMDKKHFCRKDQNIYHRWLSSVYETGQLEDDLLVKIWEVQRERKFPEYKEDLLKFMQRLGMLVAVHETDEDLWYYIPCMNRRKFSQKNDLEGFVPQSTLLCFRFKILPNFIFYHIVVLVASLPEWKFNKRHLYSAAAILNFCDMCYVVMGMCKNEIQVQLFSIAGETVSRVVKIEISHILVDTMRKIIQMYQMNLSYAIGYRCEGTRFCDSKHDNFMELNLMKKVSISPLPICDSCQIKHRYDPVDVMWEICPKSYELIGENDFSSVAELVYDDIISLRLDRAFTRQEWENEAFQNTFMSLLCKKTEKQYKTNLQFVFLTTRYATSDIVMNLDSDEVFTSLKKRDVCKNLLVDAKYDKISETTYNIRAVSWVVAYGRNSLLDLLSENINLNTNDEKESARFLILACLCGEPDILKRTLAIWGNGINTSVLGSENHLYNKHRLYTPLTAACQFNTGAIPAFLEAGADVLKANDAGYTAVDILIENKDWFSFKNFLCTKQNLEKIVDITFIHQAIENCYPCDVFECVISRHTYAVNFCDNKKETPLHYSARSKQKEYTDILIRYGSIIDALNDKGMSPLNVSSALGHVCVVDVLLKYGAKVNRCDHSGRSALSASSEGGYKDVVSLLINHGANVNLPDKSGRTSLSVASEGGHKDVVSLLINHDANMNRRYKLPLVVASERGYKDVISLLIDHGTDVNLCDQNKRSPLFAASKAGHNIVVSLLINHGADVNLCNQNNQSPLFAAAKGGHKDVAKLLIIHGADLNLCDQNQKSPLFAAAKGGHKDVVSLLINYGADVNRCDRYGKSPLVAALKGRHKDVYSLLINHGASANVHDKIACIM